MSDDRYFFFYGGELSQWFPCEFSVGEVEYNCAEQYMMAEKARLFGDENSLEEIMESSNPREQKSLGRLVSGFDPDTWNLKAKRIVYAGNLAKFSQNNDLKDCLLSTYPRKIVEASRHDSIWGIGLSIKDDRRFDESKWNGTNLLGKILTAVRSEFVSGMALGPERKTTDYISKEQT